MRQLALSLVDTGTTPAASGPDQFLVASVTDLGAGNYTIILNRPTANGKDLHVLGWSAPADTNVAVTAVAFDRVTVQVSTLAGAPKDEDFSLSLLAHDARYEI